MNIKFSALTNSGLLVEGFYVYDEHLNLHQINNGKGIVIAIKPETLKLYVNDVEIMIK